MNRLQAWAPAWAPELGRRGDNSTAWAAAIQLRVKFQQTCLARRDGALDARLIDAPEDAERPALTPGHRPAIRHRPVGRAVVSLAPAEQFDGVPAAGAPWPGAERPSVVINNEAAAPADTAQDPQSGLWVGAAAHVELSSSMILCCQGPGIKIYRGELRAEDGRGAGRAYRFVCVQ